MNSINEILTNLFSNKKFEQLEKELKSLKTFNTLTLSNFLFYFQLVLSGS